MSASAPAPVIPAVATATFSTLCQLATRLELALKFPSGSVADKLKEILFDRKFNFIAEQKLTSEMVAKAQSVIELLTSDVYCAFDQIVQLKTIRILYAQLTRIVDDFRSMIGLPRLIPHIV